MLKNINFILNVLTKLNPVDVKNKDYEFGLKDMAYKINLRPVQAAVPLGPRDFAGGDQA